MTRSEFSERLRAAGHKITPQRVAIWDCLAEGDHLSVDNIHQCVFAALNFTDSSTVYRTIDLLKQFGLIEELVLEDGSYYELASIDASSPRGHFVCRQCRTIHELSIENDSAATSVVESSFGDVAAVELVLYGTCITCKNADSEEAPATGEARLLLTCRS